MTGRTTFRDFIRGILGKSPTVRKPAPPSSTSGMRQPPKKKRAPKPEDKFKGMEHLDAIYARAADFHQRLTDPNNHDADVERLRGWMRQNCNKDTYQKPYQSPPDPPLYTGEDLRVFGFPFEPNKDLMPADPINSYYLLRMYYIAQGRRKIRDAYMKKIKKQQGILPPKEPTLKQSKFKFGKPKMKQGTLDLTELKDVIMEIVNEETEADNKIKSDVALQIYFLLMDYVIMSPDPKYNTILSFKKVIESKVKDPVEKAALQQVFNREFGGSHTGGTTPWDYHSEQGVTEATESMPLPINPAALPLKSNGSDGYWIGPDGKMYSVKLNHADFAKKYIHPEATDAQTAFSLAMKEGWVRIRIHYLVRGMELEKVKMNDVQKKIIEDIAKRHKLQIKDVSKLQEEGVGYVHDKDMAKDPKHIKGERWRIKFQSTNDLSKHGNTEKSPINESLTPKALASIEKSVREKGLRPTAVRIIDLVLQGSIGLSSRDLADTTIFASGIDAVEALLGDGKFEEAVDQARETARDMLEDEGGGDLGGLIGEENITRGELKEMIKGLVSEMWIGWEQDENVGDKPPYQDQIKAAHGRATRERNPEAILFYRQAGNKSATVSFEKFKNSWAYQQWVKNNAGEIEKVKQELARFSYMR